MDGVRFDLLEPAVAAMPRRIERKNPSKADATEFSWEPLAVFYGRNYLILGCSTFQ